MLGCVNCHKSYKSKKKKINHLLEYLDPDPEMEAAHFSKTSLSLSINTA